MIQVTEVLYLMATLSDDKSRFKPLRMKKERYTQVHLDQPAYTRKFIEQKACMRTHALSRKERRVHVGKLNFGMWYLIHGISTLIHGV